MIKQLPMVIWLLLLPAAERIAPAQAPPDLVPGTAPLSPGTNAAAEMTAGIDKFLTRELDRSVGVRSRFWNRDFSSAAAYEKSVRPNRERLRRMIGAVDARTAATSAEAGTDAVIIARSDAFTVRKARWPVFPEVFAEGLLLQPRGAAVARIVAIPDADQTPEMVAGLSSGLAAERQFARRLAENGCEVLVPVLVDRRDTESGNRQLDRFTNQPHREWIYRQAFELGRHIIGYEVEKVMAAVDFFQAQSPKAEGQGARIGVMGYAEGGLIAFYSAALDTRIEAALVSGYFDSRQRVWEEPIYRNVFGLLREFGDAEIASLIAPRTLIIEHSPAPEINGPPEPRPGREGAAPGKITTPEYDSVETECERAQAVLAPGHAKGFAPPTLICGTEGMTCGPGSDRALTALLNSLGSSLEQVKGPGPAPLSLGEPGDPAGRQKRQIEELRAYTQRMSRECEHARAEFFWTNADAASPGQWETQRVHFRNLFWEEVLGRLPAPVIAANPRSRLLELPPAAGQAGARHWTGYEVRLDVYPDVFAYGYLLVPKDLKAGERRPVVVCQHGLSSGPEDTINEDPQSPAFRYYKGFAARLADRGFVVFAPQNPYRDGEQFRPLQRKANPLKLSLFSFILAQHSRLLDWLGGLPFVDAGRIGFYGLSYGGGTALRVPAVLEGYSLSICSGNFNDWVRKNVSTDFPASYMFHGEYEMPEFDLGHSFSHAEMAAMIAPRPFMVERGHADGVGVDEWVAAEYAKVSAFYGRLGIGDRTAIEFFDGGHTINGVGTFDFLHRHLGADAQ
jgi:dienelactone hydrolase